MISNAWWCLLLWQMLILGGVAGKNKTRGGGDQTPLGRMNVYLGGTLLNVLLIGLGHGAIGGEGGGGGGG